MKTFWNIYFWVAIASALFILGYAAYKLTIPDADGGAYITLLIIAVLMLLALIAGKRMN